MRLLIIGCLFVFPFALFASPLLPVFKNPMAMTITHTLVAPEKDKSVRAKITLFPERKQVPFFEEAGELKFTYRLQKDPRAPLVFVIPGVGGTSEAPGALFLAEQLFNAGYHAITLDNAFSWTFTVAASRSGLPGYAPRDAVDLYGTLEKISQKLAKEKHLHPRSYALAGYSLGALQGLFLHRLDQEAQKFHFQKLLLINPPLDMMYAMEQLDQMFAVGDALPRSRKVIVFNRVLKVGQKYLTANADFGNPALLQSAFEEMDLNDQDLAYLIGGNFRDTLRDVIVTSQQVEDLHILKSPISRYLRNERFEEARGISFNQYLKLFLFPQVVKLKKPGFTPADLNEEVSFYQFGPYIHDHGDIFLIHSSDDFLLKSGDVSWLQDTFKERALIFPAGGHCGAMNFPEFKTQVKKVFKF